MTVSRLFIVAILVATFVFSATLSQTALAETAEETFNRGNELLRSGEFQQALDAYLAAARADKSNQQYSQQFMLLRQVIALRKKLESEKNTQRWRNTAQSLRAFYVSQGMYPQALAMDRRINDKLKTTASASQLAETLLAMSKMSEAEKVLKELDSEKSTPSTQALLSIAVARQERVEEAKKIAQAVSQPPKAGSRTLYTLARMHAIVGDHDKALAELTGCLENVAPSKAAGFKAHAKQTPEFADLASTDRFATALKTKSKVPESKCSGGSSCAGCPSRGNCSKSK